MSNKKKGRIILLQKFNRQRQNQRRDSRQPLIKQNVIRDKRFQLAVIIPAMNESDTIGKVLDEVNRLEPDHVIVVDNGSTDQTASIATSKGANVVHYPFPLGNDVGRALGAMQVEADIYLFTDADIAIEAEAYLPFIKAIEQGDDVSINSIDWITHYKKADTISAGRYFLNYIQTRSDLRAENVLTIPHALSHSILEKISKASLVNPVLANSMAIEQTKKVSIPGTIDVLQMNKPRKNHFSKNNETISTGLQRMQGDTYEALHYLLTRSEHFQERIPNLFSEVELKQISESWKAIQRQKPVSFIAHIDERFCESFKQLVHTLLRNETIELIPVVSIECTSFIAWLEEINQPYVTYTNEQKESDSYYLGAMLAQGDFLFFHNANQELSLEQLASFIEKASANPDACIVNNQEHNHSTLEEMNEVFIGNQLINMANSEQKMTTSGFVLPPFVVPVKHLIEKQLLQFPVQLQMKFLLKSHPFVLGPTVEASYPLSAGKEQSIQAILDGFSYLLAKTNERGSFTDEGRRRDLIPLVLPDRHVSQMSEPSTQRIELNSPL